MTPQYSLPDTACTGALCVPAAAHTKRPVCAVTSKVKHKHTLVNA
jgi:hypothetical protein